MTNKIIYILLLLVSFSHAQTEEYIEPFDEKISAKIGFDSKVYTYAVNDENNNKLLELQPNESTRLKIGVNYKFLGLSIGFTPNFLNNDENEVLKGQSNVTTIDLRVFIKRFIQELDYYEANGFYVKNTDDYIANWTKNKDPYLQLPNLHYVRYGGKTTFVANPNFSYKSLLVNNQKQLKSTGSFIPSIAYLYSEINGADNTFIKTTEENIDITAHAGYVYNFVYGKRKNLYTSLGLSPGIGVKFSKTKDINSNESTNRTFPSFSIDAQINLGYNSDKFFSGIQFDATSLNYNKTEEHKVQDSNVYFQLFFGYRFDAPKSVSKFFDKIYKKKE